jgi:cell division protein FtsA
MTGNFIITALDIGSSAIKGMIAQRRPEREEIEVLSYFTLPSSGIRRGVVIDPEKTASQIVQLLNHLKKESQKKTKEVYVNIGGYHLFSKPTHGAVAISRADQKVSQEDIDRVIEESKSLGLGENKEILDIFPKEFIVDEEKGIKDPKGLKGIKLETEALAICVFSPYLKNLIEAVLGADLEIADIVPTPLASAKAVLTPQQKELGVVLVDIGAGTTNIAVFEEESLLHLAVLPVGSSHISNDIAIALQIDINLAEVIKRKFGRYILNGRRKNEKIEIEKGSPFVFSTKKLAKAGQARMAEIFDLINKELKKISRAGALPAGVVLTGGGSKLPGIVEFAKKSLKLPAKKGRVSGFIGIGQEPELSTVCGLILTGFDQKEQESSPSFGSKFGQKIKKFFRIFIP